MPESSKSLPEAGQPNLIARPEGQLHDLPIRQRWEVTRRHPCYLIFWRDALMYRQGNVGNEPATKLLRFAAFAILNSIGVTGEPVDPKMNFEEFGEVDPAFLSGAVQPLTLRSLAVTLISALSAAERTGLGAVFMTAGDSEYAVPDDDERHSLQKFEALGRLSRMTSNALDSYPDVPMFYVNLGASQRTIIRDLENQVRRWKERLGIPERRFHTEKLPLYLQVWDLREGWTGEGYDRARERTFLEIATELKKPFPTVVSRYGSGFKLVTGHDFTPEAWYRLLGPLKLSEIFHDPGVVLSASVRRRIQSPARRPVPDSVVSPPPRDGRATGVVEAGTTYTDDSLARADFLLDVKELIAKNFSNEGIARRLECDESTIAYLRHRIDELRDF